MIASPAAASALPAAYRIPLFIATIAVGLAGNYFKFPLFLNIDFLFGSIFSLLALQFFGPGRAVPAAAIISSYTWLLWNHPYAIIIMTAEVAAVAWLTRRRKVGLIQADAIFWLLVGMPLVYLFYHGVMHVPDSTTYITMTKQAVNGFANALAARLLYTGYILWSRSALISFREIVYNMLAFFVICPALITLAVESRIDFATNERHISETLVHDSKQIDQRLNTWIENRKSAILTLAEMASTRSPQQMQSYLELAKKSDINFERIGLLNNNAVTTAYYPLVDEQGQSNIGKNFSDRPYVPILKRTLKPMLSEVVTSRIGTPRQIVMMLAPVVSHDTYKGYAVGVLGLEQIGEYLTASTRETTSLFTLVDTNGNIITTNRIDQKPMTRFVRGSGTLTSLPNGLRMWMPTLKPGTPMSERWRESYFVSESTFGTLSEWKLILEQPVGPFQKALYDQYTGKLALLFLVLLLLALADFLSRKIAETLAYLRTLTHELPHKLATNSADISWPDSIIKEANHLINNFKQMANTLTAQFVETRTINESLEQRVVERTAELRESEALYRSILNASPDNIVITDLDGQIRMLSPIGITMFRYEREEQICGRSVVEFIAPVDCVRAAETMDRIRSGIHPGTCEYRGLRADGSEFAIEVNSDVIRDKDGRLNCIVLIVRDISDRKLAEEELRQAKEDAEAANQAKSRFLANMSHEIRTPMNGIVGLTELLLGTQLTSKQREFAELVKRSGRVLMQLISDILDLSKIEVHKITLEKRDFDLGSETLATINLMSLHAQEKGLELTSCIDPDVPRLLIGDPGRLRQVITNLIGNSVKFTAQGSVLLLIQKDAEDTHSVTLCFSVRDCGIGIAVDQLETIFEPFTQADSSTTRNYGGTGLGLTISKQLVELMGGTIDVESVEGQGSTFRFTVTLAKQRSVPLFTNPRQPQADPVSEPQQNRSGLKILRSAAPRILLAEDDPTNQLVTLAMLDKFGYRADLAHNGREAIALLEQNDYSLVLMDCMMPVMNGYETTVIIRDPASSVRNHDIPIIALTANAMQEDSDTCYSSGMNDYVTKPFDVSELLAILDTWLKKTSVGTMPAGADMNNEANHAAAGLESFNRDEFFRRNLGDIELCRDVAKIFFDHGPEYLQAIRSALEKQDSDAVRQSAHKLKGAAANLALPKVVETASLIETAALHNKPDDAGQLMAELEHRFSLAETAVHELLPAALPVSGTPLDAQEERQP